jgi:hypothetical protein
MCQVDLNHGFEQTLVSLDARNESSGLFMCRPEPRGSVKQGQGASTFRIAAYTVRRSMSCVVRSSLMSAEAVGRSWLGYGVEVLCLLIDLELVGYLVDDGRGLLPLDFDVVCDL